MIIYTCPNCGGDLQEIMLASLPPQFKKECPNCGWSHIDSMSEQIIKIPYGLDNSSNNKFNDVPCDNCPNNIKNGGSGICHCILGEYSIISY